MVTRRRRRVTTVMTVLTAVVIAISLRVSVHGGGGGSTQPAGAAPAGVGAAAPRSATTSAAPPRKHAKNATTKPKTRTSSTPPTVRPRSVTVNGAVIDTMYGPVQVQVTVRGIVVESAHAIDYPQGGGRDQVINSRAIPQLDDEAMQAQNARIDTISGATYTSDGYRRSLQSALDAAHRAT
jgi:uncharacterized protein with FMN-binding domain